MLRKSLIAMVLLSSPALADESRVTAYACDDTDCILVMDNEELPPAGFDILSKKKKTFVETAAGATGNTVGIITSTLAGIRSSVVAAGYTRFEGTLSGPAGSISFNYDFSNGSWGISGGGSPSIGNGRGQHVRK